VVQKELNQACNELETFARAVLTGPNGWQHPTIKMLGCCKGKSNIYSVELSTNQGTKPFAYIKQRSRQHPQADGIKKEYENLLALQSLLWGTDLLSSIPQPLAFNEDLNCLAITALPGSSIQRRFYIGTISGFGIRRIVREVRKFGAWLGNVQIATKQTSRISIEQVSSQALEEIHMCNYLEETKRPEIIEILRALQNDALSTTSVCCHGDFSLRNILVSPGRDISVFDWENMYVSHPLSDPVWFICNILLTTRYLARLKTILLIIQEFLSSWRSRTKALGMTSDIIRGLFVAGMIGQMCRLECKNDFWRKRCVLQNSLEVMLHLLRKW